MKITVIDINGRTPIYDYLLCDALAKCPNESNDIELLTTSVGDVKTSFKQQKLVSLTPKQLVPSGSKLKMLFRIPEIIINYIYVSILLCARKPDIIHFQWMPILDFASGEKYLIKLYKRIFKQSKIILTVHNIYPHNYPDKKKEKYRCRFLEIDKYLDGYIVHLESTRDEFHKEFSIPITKVFVVYHGIIAPNTPVQNTHEKEGDKKCIIMYGHQNHYKGTDLLIEALSLLPKEYLQKIQTVIVGKTDDSLYKKYADNCEKLNVLWINKFVSEEELYSRIEQSDLIVLPYRKISQSGVLLLALSYRKPIITSNLDSFKETLEGYPSDYFFEKENPASLAIMLRRFIDDELDTEVMKGAIEKLVDKYSWESSASATIETYKFLMNVN